MNTGDIVVLNIEKLNSEGAGLARSNNFVVFIKNACPGDTLKCKITKAKKNYAEAEIVEIITPSQYRIEPKCKLQKVCGGCSLQHIEYSEQLKYKKIIVEDTIFSVLGNKMTVNNPITADAPYEYRCKIQYPVRSRGKLYNNVNANARLYAGYFKPGTHELINIKYCPIHPHICDEIIEFIKITGEELGITGYREEDNSGELRHIVLRYSKYNNDILVTLVVNSEVINTKFKKLADSLINNFKHIKGVVINFNARKTNVILGESSFTAAGCDFIEEKLSDLVFKISGDTFFQVNPDCANRMFNFIKNYIANNFNSPKLLDTYAGIATFGITLSSLCKEVVSVELNEHSVHNAIETIKDNNITNVKVVVSDTLEYIKQIQESFDITILDPPRKGCGEEVLKNILRVTGDTIIYVSCSPKSLAQDLKFLLNNGCTIELIQPFDMFPNTPHIENVAIIKLHK